MSKRVLIAGGGTGGHLMPALAIANALRARHPDWRISMVGATRGVEATILPSRDFPYQLLPFEPIYRRTWWRNFRWPFLAIRLIREVRALLDRERPDLVVGTGGYASGPVVWAATRRKIPTAILEQDVSPGLVTRWLAPKVRHTYLGAPEARAHLRVSPPGEVFVTGSPISPPSPDRRAAAFAKFGLATDRPVILITGGSQGSLAINRLVADWIRSGGAGRFSILWAAGRATVAQFRDFHAPPAVQVFDFLDPIADAYAVADLVVARAGMMTIAELLAWGLPSVLIPLPTAAQDHQRMNAKAVAEAGAGVALEQDGLDLNVFGSVIVDVVMNATRLTAMRHAALARGKPGATSEIVDRLESIIS